MEFGTWSAQDLGRLLQSLANIGDDLAELDGSASGPGADEAWLRGFQAALRNVAQAFDVPVPARGRRPAEERVAPAGKPSKERGARARKPPEPPTWFVEDLRPLLQSISRTGDELAGLAGEEGEPAALAAYLKGFQTALQNVGRALNIPAHEAMPHDDSPASAGRPIWRRLFPLSEVRQVPPADADDPAA